MNAKRRVLPLLLAGAALAGCTGVDASSPTQSDALVSEAGRWSLPDVVAVTPPKGAAPALVVTRESAANVADEHAVLHAVRADGTELWKLNLGLPADGHPAVGADGTIYTTVAPCQSSQPPGGYVTYLSLSCAHAVVALDPATGAEKWRAPLREGYAGSQQGKVLVNPANGDVYASANAGSSGTHLHVVHKDGTPAWDRPFFTAALVAPNGTMFGVDAAASYLYAFSPAGAKLWSAWVDVTTAPPAFGPDGTIYVGDVRGTLYAFSQTGQKVFERKIGFTALRGEPIVLADGSMVLRHDHGGDNSKDELLGLDPTGAVRWSLEEALPPVLGPNGAIFAALWPGGPPGEAICAYDAVTGAKRSCSGSTRLVPLAADAKRVYAKECLPRGGRFLDMTAKNVVVLADAP